ncbi:MAG: efflux RND transporter periplasmic adaptor subunit, partial [Desulfuromonadales bacterium]|nr:efflux RND transporter periplasmic adaptor subunit [Desulfuromonadales bacterium]
ARAEFAVQEKRLSRLQQLLTDKFVSQQEFDEAQKAYDVARAELARARLALGKSTLFSPVDGVLDSLLVDRGEYVAEGAPVAVLVQVDRLKALVEVPEKDVSFLRPGQAVEVVAAAISGGNSGGRPGRIIHLAYKADPATRTYLAKVEIANDDGALRPGMITRVGFVRRQLGEVIAVPLYAVVERGGARAVFIEEAGVAHLRPVKTGAIVGDRIVIEEGLAAGDRLLVKGQQLVADGSRVSADEG